MSFNEKDKMKLMVEQIIENLKKQGVTVTSAAVLNMQNQSDPDKIEKIIKETLKTRTRKEATPLPLPVNEGGEEPSNEDCMCPGCFNFNTFEEKLAKYGGAFDYASVELLGKRFNIKYFNDGNGREHIMIDVAKPEVSQLNEADLQQLLNESVQNKDFDNAQIYLNAINNLKNQRKNG